MEELPEVVRAADEDPLAIVDAERLSEDEALYARAARAANTVKGYRSDWREWTAWCAEHGFAALPADPAAISAYLTFLAGHGARVGTMSRRLSAIRFASRLRDLPDPTEAARVVAVWEGIRRLHGAPPEQAAPLMPPELFDVLDACPETRSWKTKGRQSEPDLAGLRDRVLLLIGFVGALRRSELVGLDLDHVAEHPNGLMITLPRSKTNQTGEQAELVVLPRGGDSRRCTVTAVRNWTEAACIDSGPLLRPVSKGNRALTRRLNADSANMLRDAGTVCAYLRGLGRQRRYPTRVLTSGARTAMPEECSFRPVSQPARCGRPRSRLVRQRLRRCPRDDLRDDRCRVRGRESFVSSSISQTYVYEIAFAGKRTMDPLL